MTARRPLSPAIKRALLSIASVCFALVCVEIALRVAGPRLFQDSAERPDPVLGWSLKPNFGGWETEENTLWVKINSAGFRDRERTLARTPGKLRIALVGDSFVHAYYVPLEKTYATFLERELSQCTGAPNGVEVLSFGVQSYSTAQELLLYQQKVAAYHPDIVLLSFFTYNDVIGDHPAFAQGPTPFFKLDGDRLVLDNSFRDQLPPPPRSPLRRAVFEWMQQHSRVVLLLNDRILARHWPAPRDTDPPRELSDEALDTIMYTPPSLPDLAEAWRVTEALLVEFNREVQSAGAEFWVTTLSNNPQVDPDLSARQRLQEKLGVDNLFYPDRRIEAFAREHGIRSIKLAESLADYTAKTGQYINGGVNMPKGIGHWNETGNRVAAALTAQAMCGHSPALAAR